MFVSEYPHLVVNSKGHLEFGGCDLTTLARKYGTPLYVMNEDIIRENSRRYVKGLKSRYPNSDVAYAGKAFMSAWICNVMMEEGLLLDVVSGGELYTALRAGFPPERIIFHGNNKSRDEIAMGVNVNVGRFVVDSYYEIEALDELCKKTGKKADILLRVAPGIEAHTHEYVETGMLDSKFGFGLSNGEALGALHKIADSSHLYLRGLHSHIGSQILSLDGPIRAAKLMVEFMAQVSREFGIEIEELDLGGGLGVVYTAGDTPPSIESYLDAITGAVVEGCDRLGITRPRLLMEPGRSIVGEAGLTLYTIGSIKHVPGIRTYVCVDGGMADNPRPALYGSVYQAVPAVPGSATEEPCGHVSIAGKCCESGDILIRECFLPNLKSSDVLAVLSTGAYNYSMASNYNRLPRPAVVAVSKGSSQVVVRRETYADLVSKDVFRPKISRHSGRAIVPAANWNN